MEHEITLAGGNLTPVVKSGDTVRRAMGPWSPAVHDLLTFLEVQGFEGTPRFLGIDEQGREVLSFIKGEVPGYPLPSFVWSDKTLVEAACFLSRFHDTTALYTPPDGARWQFVYPDAARHQVVCHNDFAPYNMAFVAQKPASIMDFDLAGPGPRIWDLAYAAYRFVPLSYAQDIEELGLANVHEQARRLRLFCDAYGLQDRSEVLDMVEGRIRFLIEFLAKGAAAGNAACAKMIDEGHVAHYRRELKAFRRHREELDELFTAPQDGQLPRTSP